VLLGGLGMGYTLRAALDRLPPDGKVVVVDLNPVVVDWCRGPLATLTGNALGDRRVAVRVDDVAKVIAGSDPGAWDAIVLDLYEGPHQATNLPGDPLYGTRALERSRITLRPQGVLAVWSEEPDRAFEHRLTTAGFAMEKHRAGRGRSHIVYLGRPETKKVSARRGR
jgi:spermidine synthase